MKKIAIYFITVGLVFLGTEAIKAQQIISPMGGSGQNGFGSISYTLGELVIETYITGSKTLTQGFHQPKITVTDVNELSDPDFLITAFPNPTSNIVTLQTEKISTEKIGYALYDLSGKILLNGELEDGKVEIPFESLNPAVYFIKIFRNGIEIKTFKIVKQ